MRRKPDYPATVADLPPAPGELGIVQAFVNTADFEHGTDELSVPYRLAKWLAARIPAYAAKQLSARDVERAVEAREALRELIYANNGGEVSDELVARLDRAAAGAAGRIRFVDGGEHRREAGPGAVDGALGLIFAIVASARERGVWPRLKACSNPACRAVFWDASTNRSAVWCSRRRCGNRITKKRHQKRQRRWKSERAARPRDHPLSGKSREEIQQYFEELEAQSEKLAEELGGSTPGPSWEKIRKHHRSQPSTADTAVPDQRSGSRAADPKQDIQQSESANADPSKKDQRPAASVADVSKSDQRSTPSSSDPEK